MDDREGWRHAVGEAKNQIGFERLARMSDHKFV